jgi:hypothetical protein
MQVVHQPNAMWLQGISDVTDQGASRTMAFVETDDST